jgi:PLP dependent protein
MTNESIANLSSRYQAVQERIASACSTAGRDRSEVNLIVVSKFHPASLVLDLLSLGQSLFGENKDQEASAKASEVASVLAGEPGSVLHPDWHFVGQLQSNKVKSVLRYASTIHSLDRPSLLTALAKERARLAEAASETGIVMPATGVFIELNLTDDEQRGGIQPSQLTEFAASVLEVSGLKLLGVMGVATLEGEEERDFAAIAAASERLQSFVPAAKFISAGMSNDFETAIAFGATHLRIGTAITGPRQYLA